MKRRPAGAEVVECAACGRAGRWTPGEPTVLHEQPRSTCLVRLPALPVGGTGRSAA